MIGWDEHGHACKTGLPVDAYLGAGDLQDAENCGYSPRGVLAELGATEEQFRAGRIELVDGTVLGRGGTLGCVWAVVQAPAA